MRSVCRVNGRRFGRGARGVFLSQVKLMSRDVLRLGSKKKTRQEMGGGKKNNHREWKELCARDERDPINIYIPLSSFYIHQFSICIFSLPQWICCMCKSVGMIYTLNGETLIMH